MTETPADRRPRTPDSSPAAMPPTAGLYRLKPWYAARLRPVLEFLDDHDVSPNTVSVAGIVAAAVGGSALAVSPAGLPVTIVVLAAAAARLACANLDGNLARRRSPRRFGSVMNEIGDRLGDLLLLGGLVAHVSGPLGWGMLLAASAPSWVALATAAAGGKRHNGGPVGKTERAALVVVAAATGWWTPVAATIAVGSVVTAALRLRRAAAELAPALDAPMSAQVQS